MPISIDSCKLTSNVIASLREINEGYQADDIENQGPWLVSLVQD